MASFEPVPRCDCMCLVLHILHVSSYLTGRYMHLLVLLYSAVRWRAVRALRLHFLTTVETVRCRAGISMERCHFCASQTCVRHRCISSKRHSTVPAAEPGRHTAAWRPCRPLTRQQRNTGHCAHVHRTERDLESCDKRHPHPWRITALSHGQGATTKWRALAP